MSARLLNLARGGAARTALCILSPSTILTRAPRTLARVFAGPCASEAVRIPAAAHRTFATQSSTDATPSSAPAKPYPRNGGIATLKCNTSPVPAENTVSFITEEMVSQFPAYIQGELKTSQLVVLPGEPGGRRILVSLGPEAKVTEEALRGAVSKAVKYLRAVKATSAVQILVPTVANKLSAEAASRVIAQTALLSNYSFDKYISKPKTTDIPEFILSGVPASEHSNIEIIKTLSDATIFARDIANERADVAHPDEFQKLAEQISAQHNLSLKSIVGADLVKNNLNLLAAVGQGSRYDARLLMLEHWGDPANKEDVTLVVGKGITFDTGGLNLKPTGFMETMHLDKTGAVVALTAAATTARLKIPRNVVFVLALAENAIGSRAYKPHAIIKSHKGLTVEIGNTDAEGRLVLADALSYAQQTYKPHTVIDFATLTGACVVALGEFSAGLFTNDDQLANTLTQSGLRTYERVWRLPIMAEHEDQLKNPYADTCSTGPSRYGGASTAAAFLKKFINDGVKWAHVDIAGPASYTKALGHFPQGGTGFGVQLVTDYLLTARKQK